MALQWDWQPRQMLTNPPPSELYGLNKTVSEILASNPISHTKNLHIHSELNPQQLFSWMEKEKKVHIWRCISSIASELLLWVGGNMEFRLLQNAWNPKIQPLECSWTLFRKQRGSNTYEGAIKKKRGHVIRDILAKVLVFQVHTLFHSVRVISWITW